MGRSQYYLFLACSLWVGFLMRYAFEFVGISGIGATAASIAFCFVAVIADRWTTYQLFWYVDKFNAHGIRHDYGEHNPLLKNVKTARGFLLSPVAFILDGVVLYLSIQSAWFGPAILLIKGYAAWNNFGVIREARMMWLEATTLD